MMRLLAIIAVAMFTFSVQSKAQQTVLQGTVIEKESKAPINVRFVLTDQEGKIVRGETEQGKFKAVVNTGQQYKIVLKSGETLQYVESVSVPQGNKYKDFEKIFEVTRLREGMVWISDSPFDGATAVFSTEGRELMADIAQEMKFNRGLQLKITVSGAVGRKEAIQTYFEQEYKAALKRLEIVEGSTGSSSMNVAIVSLRK